MVSESNKPLSKGVRNKYWECYAKIVLEDLLSDKFCDLILSDKPDLQSANGVVGIEVTRAVNPKQMEVESLYSNFCYYDENKRKNAIKRIEQLGAKIWCGLLAGIKLEDSFNVVNLSIDKKCKTLSKGQYKTFDEYNLFLFSTIHADESMLKNELDYLTGKNIGRFYNDIYILVPGSMYCFDLKTGIYKTFDIDSKKQFEHATQARRMVLEGEEDAKRI